MTDHLTPFELKGMDAYSSIAKQPYGHVPSCACRACEFIRRACRDLPRIVKAYRALLADRDYAREDAEYYKGMWVEIGIPAKKALHEHATEIGATILMADAELSDPGRVHRRIVGGEHYELRLLSLCLRERIAEHAEAIRKCEEAQRDA